MLNRSIHIQPKFKNIHLIENFREKYDPLFGLVPAHMTVVFPFKSILNRDFLKSHLEIQLSAQKPFIISLSQDVSLCENRKFIWAKISKGKKNMVKIHNAIYHNFLTRYKNKSYQYTPHLTLGRLNASFSDSNKILKEASFLLQENNFECVVKEIICEIIEHNDSSTLEFSISLC